MATRKYLDQLRELFKEPAAGMTLILVAVLVLIQDRFFWQGPFLEYARSHSVLRSWGSNELALFAQLFYSASNVVLFLLIPLLFHRLVPIRGMNSAGSLGLGWGEAWQHQSLYLGMGALMLPILFLASSFPGFYLYYPLYRPYDLRDFLLYEAVYFFQFLTVEFFFRGFMLFRLERLFGVYSVLVMILPYSFIHIHKPLPEALGSIVAGVLLGVLALMGRSIWPGVFLHFGVALVMDVFCLWWSR